MAEQYYTAGGRGRRTRPSRRTSAASGTTPSTLTDDFIGIAVAFGSTLLFIGFEVNGLVEITVYPRFRFSSDDRVQGYLGYVWVPLGTPWETILEQVQLIYAEAEENYRLAVTLRSSELRAHGSQYESAYEHVADIFRECWHGFRLKLLREHHFEKEGVEFESLPSGSFVARILGQAYTVTVFPTGSITMTTGVQTGSLG